MHKNLLSKNIIFWPKTGTVDLPDLTKPYLLGFDISRPNQSGEESEKPYSSREDDLYRHPDYREPNPKPFKPSFDLYSLGIILFEIAMWRVVSLQTRRSSQAHLQLQVDLADPEFIEKVVLGPAKDLGRFTGVRYRDAVMACLNREFDKICDSGEGFNGMQEYQNEVQNRIVDAIAFCNA